MVWVKVLALRDVRNLREQRVELSPGLNVFLGQNAQGKTSLLEAVGLLARGRSFRTDDLGEVVARGARRASRSEAPPRGDEGEADLAFRWTPEQRTFSSTSERSPRASTPVASRRASTRRTACASSTGRCASAAQYIDRAGAALSAAYRQTLRDYERIVQQRTAALQGAARDSRPGTSASPRWAGPCARAARLRRAPQPGPHHRLSAGGGDLRRPGRARRRGRERSASTRSRLADEIGKAPSGSGRRAAAWSARTATPSTSWSTARTRRVRLLRPGAEPASGPDPGHPARLPRADGRTAVALLDDLDSELDADRALAVCRDVADQGQALVTSAHPEWASRLGDVGRLFHVSAGRVSVS